MDSSIQNFSPSQIEEIQREIKEHTQDREERIYDTLLERHWEDATFHDLRMINNEFWNMILTVIDPRFNKEQGMISFRYLEELWEWQRNYFDRLRWSAPKEKRKYLDMHMADLLHGILHWLLGIHHHWEWEIAIKWAEYCLYRNSAPDFLEKKLFSKKIKRKRPDLEIYLSGMFNPRRYKATVNTRLVRDAEAVQENPDFDEFSISRRTFKETIAKMMVIDKNISLHDKKWRDLSSHTLMQIYKFPVFKAALTAKDKEIITAIIAGKYIEQWLSKKYEDTILHIDQLQEAWDT